jgi:uncharacterized membrane protein YfcA
MYFFYKRKVGIEMDATAMMYFCFALAACLYAMVGHGGASAYLALMVFWEITPNAMKPLALVLNMFVSLIAFFQFYKQHLFSWKLFIPLIICSIPAAFLGGTISISDVLYKRILAMLLLFTAIRFFYPLQEGTENEKAKRIWILYASGISIGFVSGLIGIGGGVLLTPVLVLFKFCTIKVAGGISALFIFFNSLAGLAGQGFTTLAWIDSYSMLLLWVIIGGSIGAYLGSNYLPPKVLKKLLAIVLLIASIKLLLV